jgi:hypothetical protein
MTMNRIGIALHPNAQGVPDLALTADGNLEMVTDAEAVGQHAAQRLHTFEGEWFLDTTAGVVWLDKILGRSVDLPLASSVIKAELMDTDGVTGIESFDLRFDRAIRRLDLARCVISTEYDEAVRL